jgi:hypothetical protein
MKWCSPCIAMAVAALGISVAVAHLPAGRVDARMRRATDCSLERLALRRGRQRFMGGPGRRLFELVADVRPHRRRRCVNGTAAGVGSSAPVCGCCRRASCAVRARRRARHRPAARVLVPREGVDLMTGAVSPPSDGDALPVLPALVLMPLIGAIVLALMPRTGPSCKQVAVLFSSVDRRPVGVDPARVRQGRVGLPVRRPAGLDRVDRHLAGSFGVDGISLFLVVLTGLLFPLAIIAVEARPRREGRTTPGCWCCRPGAWACSWPSTCSLFFVFFEIVLVPMYFLIGKWGHGNASTPPRSSSSTRCSARRSCWWHRRPRRAGHARRPAAGSPSTCWPSPSPGDRHETPPAGSSWLRHRVRREGAALPVAHLAARRPHRGAHRGLGDPGRASCSSSAPTASCASGCTCSPRPRCGRPGARDPRRHRHHLRRHRRHHAEGPQAARRLLLGRPPGLHRRAPSPSTPRA